MCFVIDLVFWMLLLCYVVAFVAVWCHVCFVFVYFGRVVSVVAAFVYVDCVCLFSNCFFVLTFRTCDCKPPKQQIDQQNTNRKHAHVSMFCVCFVIDIVFVSLVCPVWVLLFYVCRSFVVCAAFFCCVIVFVAMLDLFRSFCVDRFVVVVMVFVCVLLCCSLFVWFDIPKLVLQAS